MRELGIGQSVPRTEDARFVQGLGRYTDDNAPTDAGHLYVLRSPHAHARILAIDAETAASMPGVIGILTGAEAAADGLGSFATWARKPGPDGNPNFEPPYRLLALDKVRFAGDPVVAVIAQTLNEAKDAAESIEIDYEPLPAAPDIASALASDAPLVWDECDGNLCVLTELGNRAATNRAFENATHIVRQDIFISRITALPMEPRTAFATYDSREDRFTLHGGMQGPHGMRAEFARILNLPESKLRVVAADVGGSFGLKGMPHPEMGLVLWAAKRFRVSVRWVAERTESFLGDQHARDNQGTVELALDKSEQFLGLRIRNAVNLGAYLSATGVHCAVNNLGGVAGVYKIPAMHAEIRACFSHSNPTSAYRGAGRPEASLLIERTIDAAAHQLGMDPAELRLRNLIQPSEMPYNTGFMYTYDSGDFPTNQKLSMQAADWSGFADRRRASERAGKLRGRGMAHVIEIAAGVGDEMAEINFEPNGNAVLTIGTHSQGQGHETTLQQLMTEFLGLKQSQVTIRYGDSDQIPFGRGAGGSRVGAVSGFLVQRLSDEIIRKAKDFAASMLEASAGDIEFDNGTLRIAGTDRSVTLTDVARASFALGQPQTMKDSALGARLFARPAGPTFPNGCHICEVEIDPDTGQVSLAGYWVVEDVGRVINSLIVKGQVHGGVAQGIGQALGEQIIYGDDGQLYTGSFMDYPMPRAGDLCNIEVISNGVPAKTNPLGIKGAGEGGTVGALPAVMNAVTDALRQVGITDFDMPATPMRVWQALQAARNGKGRSA